MSAAPRRDVDPPRRGAVLLEVLLSLALFVGAAGFALGAMGNAISAVDRAGRRALALDLACSKLAELEAGLAALADLRDGELDRVGSIDLREAEEGAIEAWRIAVVTERTAFTGLVLVTVTVTPAGASAVEASATSATVRQLVPLPGYDEPEKAYEADELLRGLPSAPAAGEGSAPGPGRRSGPEASP